MGMLTPPLPASQRAPPPGAAPGQSPPAAPGYAPPPSDQHPTYPPAAPYGAPAYGVPAPASTGALDLSAIRPVNSGTVSIADAIAKAKSYAAEAGVAPYDRPAGAAGAAAVYSPPSHDVRGDGRDYRRRSRSRSPAGARREVYRDDYNPYRDERREERRGDYGHHRGGRSFSPEERARGGAHRSGRGGERSPRGDDNNETIQIEASLVGLIIGRQGENLRRIEGETGCRVQFLGSPDGNSSMRQCKISGPRAQRSEVKTAIDRIIRDTGVQSGRGGPPGGGPPDRPKDHRGGAAALKEGEDHVQIMVPDPTVGLIIGRGGETIRDLQERSGCHINIVGETKSMNGLRPVNLIGTVEAAQRAKDLIMEIVDSDSRGEGGSIKKNVLGKGDAGYEEHRGGSGTPGGAYGGGSGGGGGGGGAGGYGGDGRVNDTIRVPSEAVGMIIGKRGDTIREIQNMTGCKINVAQSSGEGEVEREIALIGSADSVSRAKQAIDEKVDAVVSAFAGFEKSMKTES